MTSLRAPRYVLTTHVEEHLGRPAATTHAEVFAQVALADRLGFDALWLAEHHFGAQAGMVSQPLLVALAAAKQTAQIKVGTSLIVLPLHHPIEIAEQLATLDLLTDGRLSIGFGSGSAPFEFAGFDAPFDGERRHPRFREGLDVLERAWTGETFSHEGPNFTIGEVRLVPRPTRPLRDFAWLGAMSAPSAALAGEFGYGLQLPRGQSADHYAGPIGAFREALRSHWGLDAPERLAIARCIYVGEDDDSALADVGATVQRFYETSKGYDKTKPTPSAEELIARLHFIVGGPERVAREIATFVGATGITHLSVQPTWIGMTQELTMASLHRFGAAVMPHVEALLGAATVTADAAGED
jgi:alkanesulfonate monooxygenase SsuD/methylene tetrahydromethanopterin reductase-like flavin-dependent oxidoreductase (luciferase family)